MGVRELTVGTPEYDQPEPMSSGEVVRWMKRTEAYWRANPEPALSWDYIRREAHTETIARLRDPFTPMYIKNRILDTWGDEPEYDLLDATQPQSEIAYKMEKED